MSAEKQRFATVEDPTFEAITEGLFRFEREAQANSLLSRIAKQYLISKDQQPPILKLWIRGFALTPAEKDKGYFGHYALLKVARLEGGKVTIKAEKLDIPLKFHPQKLRIKRQHPNWGHPIIRAAQRGKTYPDIEQARAELLRLHEEFPEISIPGRDKLSIMIYSREAKPPICKVLLRIELAGEKEVRLVLTENMKPKNEKQSAAPVAATTFAAPAEGKFTALVKMTRKKKPVTRRKKED